ncbi:MAG: SAM-dependent methyltransferase [Bacteroidia bacterium]|nr:SAM-dependent methyltransferase [Bacteroidia bacterium]
MPTLDEIFWENRYQQGETGWDIGYGSPALTAYFETLPNKNISILIPGCGNAHEVDTLLHLGFTDITVLDIAASPLKVIEHRQSQAIEEGKLKLVCGDFFKHEGQYDFIMEQTFFCAIVPALRDDYAKQMHFLLKKEGVLAGLLFNFPLSEEGPPFGCNREGYFEHFGPFFKILSMEPCENSIKPRAGRELFFILQKAD